MRRYWILVGLAVAACGEKAVSGAGARPKRAEVTALDSAWIRVAGPTLIAFHPSATNAQLEADAALAATLDDLAYHIGTAIPELERLGMAVHYVAGDTVRIRPDSVTWVRAADSLNVGFLLARPGHPARVIYGVRTSSEVIRLATDFIRP